MGQKYWDEYRDGLCCARGELGIEVDDVGELELLELLG